MNNRNLLIGAGVVVVGYLLWKKSQNKVNKTQYSKECYDSLQGRLMQEDVKPPNFEKDFLERCEKKVNQIKALEIKNKPVESGRNLGMPQVKPETPEEKKAFHDILVKMLPNEFTIKQSANSNVKYYKGNNQDFYKVGYSTTGFSGMMPIKISFAEYSNAYNEFKNQPK